MSFCPRIRPLVAALAVAAMAVGCAPNLREQPAAMDLDAQALEAYEEYRIGSGDKLSISVWKQPELSVQAIEVRSDGKISVPLLDDVQADGRTALELKQVITERLEEYVTAPHVTVAVISIESKIVFVLGEVVKEGAVPLRRDMRAIDVIAIAGGFNPFAGRDSVKIIRQQNGSAPQEFLFNYDAFVDGKNLEQNILLLPGDRVIVPEQKPFWQ